jgi:hypothetical protein
MLQKRSLRLLVALICAIEHLQLAGDIQIVVEVCIERMAPCAFVGQGLSAQGGPGIHGRIWAEAGMSWE